MPQRHTPNRFIMSMPVGIPRMSSPRMSQPHLWGPWRPQVQLAHCTRAITYRALPHRLPLRWRRHRLRRCNRFLFRVFCLNIRSTCGFWHWCLPTQQRPTLTMATASAPRPITAIVRQPALIRIIALTMPIQVSTRQPLCPLTKAVLHHRRLHVKALLRRTLHLRHHPPQRPDPILLPHPRPACTKIAALPRQAP
jgi:hypothetical protein